jgi:hypothetical protein
MGTTPVTDVPTDVEIVVPDEVRDVITARGGRLYVWVSVHQGFRCALALLDVSSTHPKGEGLYFRRVPAPGFELYLQATQRIWPKTMEFGLRRRRVEAYWNGLAWIA